MIIAPPQQKPYNVVMNQGGITRPSKNLIVTIVLIVLIALVSTGIYLLLRQGNPQSTTPEEAEIVIEDQDMTLDWETYRNDEYSYQFKCPQDAKHEIRPVTGDGKETPLHQEVCSLGENEITIEVYTNEHITSEIRAEENLYGQEYLSPSGDYKIILSGHDENFINQVMSTFTLTGS